MPILICVVLLMLGPLTFADDGNESVHRQYDQSWEVFIDGLQQARQALIAEQAFAPRDQNSRISAEGYRYLLGHLERMLEMHLRLDPLYPEFHASMNMLRKWTIENPDAMYLKAPIRADGYYKVRGKAANTAQWQTSERTASGPKAPRLVTFQTITAVPGDSGNLQEMANCSNQTLDFLNSFNLELDANGQFELLIGPTRPAGHQGNFLLSKKSMDCPGDTETRVRQASWLAVREIFSDWANEQALQLDITRLDHVGHSRPPLTTSDLNTALEEIGRVLPRQIRFWNMLHEIPLEVYEDHNKDGRRNMPVNDLNPPAPPFTAGGVAGSQQIYSGGLYELADDEVLLIKVEFPQEPHYVGFQLGTPWGEGPDQQNFTSSLSGHQNPLNAQGSRYYLVSKLDPGLQGWVATTGLQQGTMSMRFVFREPPETAKLPRIQSKLLKRDQLKYHLPEKHPRISAEQRNEQIAVRQAHIKRRWRAY